MIPFEVAIEIDDDGITIDLTDAPPAQPGPVNSPYVGVVSAIRCAMHGARDRRRARQRGLLPAAEAQDAARVDVRRAAAGAMRARQLPALHPDRGRSTRRSRRRCPSGCRADSTCACRWSCGASTSRTAFWADSINVVGGAPAAALYGDGGGPLMPVACSGVRGVSWEVWEAKTPMVVETPDFAPDSAGAGRHRGGPGVDLAVTGLLDMELTVVNERSQVPPFAAGGWRARAGATRRSSISPTARADRVQRR